VVFSFNSLLSPAQNTIYQANIRVQNRGALFGYVSSIQTLVMVSVGYIAGTVLDIDEELFRLIFVIIGVCGLVSSLLMALIKSTKQIDDDVPPLTMRSLFRDTIGSSMKVLKTNRDFACFERNFFLYGIGYMVVLPAIPKYLVEYLHMDYTHTFLGKVILAQLGVLALSPLAGKLHDKKNPAWFTFVSFGLLSCYPLLLFVSSLTIGSGWENFLAYAAFLIFGVAMAGVAVAWNISSIYFAGNRDVSMYQGVHVTLTGMRGLFAPFLGYALLSIVDVRATFVLAFVLQVTASVLSLKLYREMEAKRFSTEELLLGTH
jgi:MFS family permease